MTFEVDCDRWVCGKVSDRNSAVPTMNSLGKGATRLLNGLDYKCCLGFVEEQQGRSVEFLKNISTPDQLCFIETDVLQRREDDEVDNSDLSADAMSINDDDTTSVLEKINRLTETFRIFGHEIVFINIPMKGI